MDKNIFGIFIAQQSTTYENIKLIIEEYTKAESNKFIFINQANIYKNNLDNFLNLDKENVYKFKKPLIKVKNPYSPSLLVKIIYFLKIKFILRKYLKRAEFICFSPGGFVEGELARIVKNNNGKVIQIEGGLPNDLINKQNQNKLEIKNKLYYKLPFKRFLNNPRLDPLANVDYFISSGLISKQMHSTLRYDSKKILNIGLPRFEKLTTTKKLKKIHGEKVKNLIYIAGAYDFHNENSQSKEMLNNIEEIYNLLKENKEISFSVKIHPRQSNFELTYIKNNFPKVSIIESDKMFEQIVAENSIMLTRYSNLAYEMLYLNLPTYFYKPPILRFENLSLPNEDLIINNILELKNLILNFNFTKINNFSQYSQLFYSETTHNSAKLIAELINKITDE